MKAAAKKKPAGPPPDLVEIFDCEQGEADWQALRMGIPTASRFSAILAEGKDGEASKTRDTYMRALAGEIITGIPCETFSSDAMDRGHAMEPEICDAYAEERLADLSLCGFVRRTIYQPFGPPVVVGCSPDRLVGAHGLLQVKTMRPDLMIEMKDRGAQAFPSGHKAQCQGELSVTGRQWLDLRIGYRGMPFSLTFRMERDEGYIQNLAEQTTVFCYQLRQMVERLRGSS